MRDFDSVNHPPHYKGTRWECIEVIEAYRLGYHLGNAFAYLVRHRTKHILPELQRQDIEKAIWYLERYVDSDAAKLAQERAWREHDASMPGYAIAEDVRDSFNLPEKVNLATYCLLRASFTNGSASDWILSAHAHLTDYLTLTAMAQAEAGDNWLSADDVPEAGGSATWIGGGALGTRQPLVKENTPNLGQTVDPTKNANEINDLQVT